jgi:hypothetical protein
VRAAGRRNQQYLVVELIEFLQCPPQPGHNSVDGRQKDLRHERDSQSELPRRPSEEVHINLLPDVNQRFLKTGVRGFSARRG